MVTTFFINLINQKMKIKLIATMASLLLLSGCYSFRETAGQYERLPLKVTKNPAKEGRACNDDNVGLFNITSDTTVETARKAGGITEIVSIEKEVSGGLLHRRICTIVKGN